MLVGDKSRFAIEFELDEEKLADPALAEWLYGRIRWWCGGEPVGLFDDDTTLRDAAIDAERVLAAADSRRDDALMQVSAQEVVDTIVRALFEDLGQSDEELAADEKKYRPFLARPLIGEFDAWDIFVIEGGREARLIWRLASDARINETRLAAGEFDSVLKKFLTELRSTSIR